MGVWGENEPSRSSRMTTMDASWFSVPVVAEIARRFRPTHWLVFSSSNGRLLPLTNSVGTMSLLVFVRSRRGRLREVFEISDMNENGTKTGNLDEEE